MARRIDGAIALILFALFLFSVPNSRGAISETVRITLDETFSTSTSVVLLATTPSAVTVKPEAVIEAPRPLAPSGTPLRLIIPSISLDSPIQDVGTNSKGEMDVPSGRTNRVGWYKDGTTPGLKGTAVFDAHVFAAFKNLDKVKPGDDIYVLTSTGEKLHFVASNAKTYSLNSLSADTLFGSNGGRKLNLITCAGALTSDRSTYDHRLIVFTDFVGVDS